MWALTLLLHPDSPYADFSYDTKEQIVIKEYLPKDVPFDSLSTEIDLFKHLVLTKPQRFLIEWERKLEERQNFLTLQPYTLDNADDLDKALANTAKLWKVYMDCRKDVELETAQTAQGGVQESASESGLI